jgi:hypothetical protein
MAINMLRCWGACPPEDVGGIPGLKNS